MQKMVLLPYDRYQRLLSHDSKTSPKAEIQETTETPSDFKVEGIVSHGETGDYGIQTIDETSDLKADRIIPQKATRSTQTTRKRRAQLWKGDIPPPPGIPPIKWLKL